MTPIELEQLYDRFNKRHASTTDYAAFIVTVREAIAATREEDALIADWYVSRDNEPEPAKSVAYDIAAAIRRSR